ncbi:acyl-CoA dehydrogenase family protein [Olivibacter ginsenosidimutans]|uniref:Acyl-CoA dehydrogenase family protein n=2 Tax=Olivibacter ginsenosidimutans TaxID=1176537 RepID=A0ABP9BV02_9SPHI
MNVAQPTDEIQNFDVFINAFRKRLASLFSAEYDYNAMSLQRGLLPSFLSQIMDMKPLAVAIPESHGGRGMHVKECLSVLSAASYESLSLSLIFGINIALFLEPFAKYGHVAMRDEVFKAFLENKAMGGLMITEPNYGSDALNMQTYYEEGPDCYRIKGEKHWQGLTGAANYWLVAARRKNEQGELMRDIDFFLTDNARAKQQIEVKERYNSLGLYAIPYGLNQIDVEVPIGHRLLPESTGLKLMLDTLHRSRLQFPGMGMGFIKRLLDEALQHCKTRQVAGLRLNELDAVRFQLSRLQAAYTLCSAMCAYGSKVSSIDQDVSGNGIDANSVKALVTDFMHESAQIALQLSGANGYRLDHIAGRAVVDSRPFQIFEGSNEMLYTQVAESVAKLMRKAKERNLLLYLKGYALTTQAAPYFAKILAVDFPEQPKKRDLVTLGKIIARVICFQMVVELQDAGFNKELVESTRQHIRMDLHMLMGQLSSDNHAAPLLDYEEDAHWVTFL